MPLHFQKAWIEKFYETFPEESCFPKQVFLGQNGEIMVRYLVLTQKRTHCEGYAVFRGLKFECDCLLFTVTESLE